MFYSLRYILLMGLLISGGLGVATVQAQAPLLLNQQGRVLGSNGKPAAGVQSMTFQLYTVATGGTSVWKETVSLTFRNGYYSVQLGTTASLQLKILEKKALWLGATVGSGSELKPRHRITSVPYALLAMQTRHLKGGDIDANIIKIKGKTVIDGSGKWVGNSSGLRGSKGDRGDKGEKGAKGTAGSKGDKGDKGSAGIAGIAGAKGVKGDKGSAGSKGDKGDKGVKGDKGDKGTRAPNIYSITNTSGNFITKVRAGETVRLVGQNFGGRNARLRVGQNLLIPIRSSDTQLDVKLPVNLAITGLTPLFVLDTKNQLASNGYVIQFGVNLSTGSGRDGVYVASSNRVLTARTYHFKSFVINRGVTVTVSGSASLVLLVQGEVRILGNLTLNGKNGVTVNRGYNNGTCYNGGAGGGGGGNSGGRGCYGNNGSNGKGVGYGRGAGSAGVGGGGGGAGYSSNGITGARGAGSSLGSPGVGGRGYGSAQLASLLGGSGGGGGGYGSARNSSGSGGGGGGGAIKIIASKITVSGRLSANGGNGGNVITDFDGGAGGGGSGGSIWLRAVEIFNTGSITAIGGNGGVCDRKNAYGGNGGRGAHGRIRIDSFKLSNSGTLSPSVGFTQQL